MEASSEKKKNCATISLSGRSTPRPRSYVFRSRPREIQILYTVSGRIFDWLDDRDNWHREGRRATGLAREENIRQDKHISEIIACSSTFVHSQISSSLRLNGSFEERDGCFDGFSRTRKLPSRGRNRGKHITRLAFSLHLDSIP